MIRELKHGDLDTCVQLLIETYNCEPWKNKWTVNTATRYLSEFFSSNDFVGFVSEVESNIIGSMFAHKKLGGLMVRFMLMSFLLSPLIKIKDTEKHCSNMVKNTVKQRD